MTVVSSPAAVAPREASSMSWERVQGRWVQLGGRLRTWWGALRGDEELALRGRKLEFMGAVQARTLTARREAEDRIDALLDRLDRNREARHSLRRRVEPALAFVAVREAP
jgi:uncharacterized protein YjbJ (UPF0337 family)